VLAGASSAVALAGNEAVQLGKGVPQSLPQIAVRGGCATCERLQQRIIRALVHAHVLCDTQDSGQMSSSGFALRHPSIRCEAPVIGRI